MRARVFPAILILSGVAAIALALLASFIGIDETPGIGAKQALLALAGVLAMVSGVLLLTPAGQGYARNRGPLPPEVPESKPWVLLIALWWGLAAALPELTLIMVQKLLGHRFLGLSTHAAWMTPIPYVVLFVATAAILALGASVATERAVHLRSIAVVFGFLSVFSILLLFHPAVHVLAIALLAAGIASELGKLVSRHRRGFHRLVKYTTVPMVLVVVITGVTLPAFRSAAERRTIAALPPAPPMAPNVLLIILDTVRWANLSAYGYERSTSPWLESMAAEGVLFESAFSPAPWTLPAHASLFTGYYAHDVSADWDTPLDDAHPTLAELLRDRGYRTAGFVGNRLYAGPHSGLGRGFVRYDADVVSVSEVFGSASFGRYLGELEWFRHLIGFRDMLGRKSAGSVSGELLSWLDRPSERPFFVFLNYYDAHDPYLPASPFAEQFRTTDRECVPSDISASTVRTRSELVQCVDAYDGAIAELDAHLESTFAELRRRGLLDNTLVIITSDHGEEFGEHGLANHGRSLYMPALRIPLILWFPGHIPTETRVADAVSTRDIPATVLDLAGFGGSGLVPGLNLARHWSAPERGVPGRQASEPLFAETSGRTWLSDHNPVSRGDMRSLIADGMHYILNGDGTEELYRIVEDPWEYDDLTGQPGEAGHLAWFRAVLNPPDESRLGVESPTPSHSGTTAP
jgi:arylsulfatase A-like enzyme